MSFDTQTFASFKDDPRFDVFTHMICLDQDLKANEITWLNPATAKVSFPSTPDVNATISGTTTATFTPPSTATVGGGSYFNSSTDLHYFDVYLGSDFKSAMYSTGVEMTFHTEQVRGPVTLSMTTAAVLTATTSSLFVGAGCIPAECALDSAGAFTPSKSYPVVIAGGSGAYALQAGSLQMGGSTIPWNTIGSFFQTLSFLDNQQQQVVEQYVNVGTLPAVSTAKFLVKYKRDALENNDMVFNTPCIEKAFDTTVDISNEGAERAARWWAVGNGIDAAVTNSALATYNGKLRSRKMIIPFSDMFESLEMEGILINSNRYRFQFTMNTPDRIAINTTNRLFYTTAEGTAGSNAYFEGKLYVFVDEMRIISDCARMQPKQAIMASEEKIEGRVENLGWLQNYAVSVPYATGTQLVLTAQRDVQSIIVGCPALGNTVGGSGVLGINPCQFYNGLMSYLQPQYGNDIPFKTPLKLSQSALYNVNDNASAYYMYRKQCNNETSRELPCALSFRDYKMYHFYYMPIYSPLSIHRNNDPKDCRVDTNGASSDAVYGVPATVYMIARKFQGAQLMPDGSVAVMSQ